MSYDATLGGGGWTVGDIKPPIQGATGFPAAGTAGHPAGAVPVASTSTTVNATSSPSLPAAAGKTTYLTGVHISGLSATTLTGVAATVGNTLGGDVRIYVDVPAVASKGAINPVEIVFNPPLPATAVNTAISGNLPAFGAGSAAQTMTLIGFQL